MDSRLSLSSPKIVAIFKASKHNGAIILIIRNIIATKKSDITVMMDEVGYYHLAMSLPVECPDRVWNSREPVRWLDRRDGHRPGPERKSTRKPFNLLQTTASLA
jgi:hypothetical protein